MSESTPEFATNLGDELLLELVDDYLRRYRAGEQPTADEYASKHPEFAERIRELFPAMIAMEQPGPDATMDLAPPTERVGATIGRYKLLERIGEGGFGVVYMAEQQHPVRRKVALKVVKPGMDSRQVLARFEAERQALAIMDHPNIAKVFDAGATDSGRPYFVMELIKGEPITEFCDRNHFSPHERLELFAQVCHAVQHAHQKGIIHRDIKPTNVLVEMHDTTPVVKVIDFGVAKALGQDLTDKTLFTEFAQLLGTPLYMSPEQAGQSSMDIDTRSDIYSLGVLLYELLTGTTPFDKERFKKAAHHEILRIIREEEPPKPSTRLSESKESLPSISAQRQMEPAKLTKLVRGELDWIVMKALEKDRQRRYETASNLARDIERYLRDETVEACPPSAAYRLHKLARRHRVAVLIAAVLMTALLALIASLVATNRVVTKSRNEVAAALRQKEQALDEAEAQRQRAEDNFLQARIAVQDLLLWPALGRDGPLPDSLHKKIVEVATKYYTNLGDEDSTDPSLRYDAAVGQRTLGFLSKRIGDLKRSEELLRRSISILESLSRAHPARPEYRQQLAWSHYMISETFNAFNKPAEALTSAEQARDMYEALLAEHADSAIYRDEVWRVYLSLASMYLSVGRTKEAAEMLSRRIASQPDDPWAWYEAAGLYALNGDVERYRGICREMLTRFEKLADENPDVADRTAKTCALTTDAVSDFSRIESLAERNLQRTEKLQVNKWFVLTAALVDYRRERFERVLDALQSQSFKDEGVSPAASALAITAMAHHRLGHADQARASLESARNMVAQTPKDQRSGNWIDWVHCEILLREAEDSLKN